MSVFQWNAIVDAHNETEGGDNPEAPSAAEFAAAVARFG